MLISHHTFLQLSDSNAYAMRVIDRVQVKGKVTFVSVYEVFEPDPPAIRSAKLKSRTEFENGLADFYQRRYAKAIPKFQHCLTLCPADKIAQNNLDRARRFEQEAARPAGTER
ncbi:MAG: hypothetical protein ACFB0G_21545 [Leptolyngbyaceae cyanobacterium]